MTWRGLTALAVTAGALGLSGCAKDNEAEANIEGQTPTNLPNNQPAPEATNEGYKNYSQNAMQGQGGGAGGGGRGVYGGGSGYPGSR